MTVIYRGNPNASFHTISLHDRDLFLNTLQKSLNNVDLKKFSLIALINSIDDTKEEFGDIDVIFTPAIDAGLGECLIETERIFEEIAKYYAETNSYVISAPEFCSQPLVYSLSRQFKGNAKKQIPIHRLIFENVEDALSVTTNNFPIKIKNKLTPLHGSFQEFSNRPKHRIDDSYFYIAKTQAEAQTELPTEYQFQNRLRILGYLSEHYDIGYSYEDFSSIPNDDEAKKVVHNVLLYLDSKTKN